VRWEKLGLIYQVSNNHPWMLTHAANPVAQHIVDDNYRIYFSTRDSKRRSSIAYILININQPDKVLEVSENPVLSPGEIGCFDDSGVSMGCILTVDDEVYLYYLGWNLGVTVPWRNSIGLAISKKGRKFERVSRAPVLDRNNNDPFSISYPYVMQHDGEWHMWYGSNLKWGSEQNDMDHLLKYAVSKDGIKWEPTGDISVNFNAKNEYAMSKPSVLLENNIYKMWYSYRGDSYRIGYAESLDGVHFDRRDDLVGIDVSDAGWDSKSIEYPNVFDHKENRYMLYNGNDYGLTGIGMAIQVEK